MIAFDMVRVGENYGVIYENINAKSLSQEICEHPEKLDDYAHMIADTLKKLHSTEFEKGVLPSSKERLIKDIAVSPHVKNWIRKPAAAIYKKKFFKMIDSLHPIP